MQNDKKIKVLFRHRSMEMGGVEKVMLSLLHNLDSEKFEMTVLLNLNQGELRDEIPSHVRKVYLVEGKEDLSKIAILQKIQLLRRRKKLQKLIENPKYIDENILKENYDIEIGMTYNDFDSVLNSSNKNSKKIGWFHSEINIPKIQPLVPGILKQFPQFHHMVYCSEKIKNIMHQSHPNLDYPSESVIINAIPAEEILLKSKEKISDFPSNTPVFVSIGRLHTRKGYHKLMDAHAKLISEGLQHSVLILGDGEEKKQLLEQQKKLGVEKTFIFVGNKMNPYPYLAKSDFFIMPSESEAWPLVIAEAMISQKPIIATQVGDVPQMIDDQKTGYLINYSTQEIYQAMKLFLEDNSIPQNLTKNLQELGNPFHPEKIFGQVEHLLTEIVKS